MHTYCITYFEDPQTYKMTLIQTLKLRYFEKLLFPPTYASLGFLQQKSYIFGPM